MPESVYATLRQPENIRDPYGYYRKLREESPVLRDPTGIWFVSRYADIAAVLGSADTSSDRIRPFLRLRPDNEDPEVQKLFETVALQLPFLDGSPHTRTRALVNRAFTPQVVQRMRPTIQRITQDLLDRALGRDRFDVIHDLAGPLPMKVICDMLAIPEEDRPRMRRWSDDLAVTLSGLLMLPHETVLSCARSLEEYMAYFDELANRRCYELGDDLLSGLLCAERDMPELTRRDVCATCVILITAGHETTTHLIGNGLLALLRDRQALASVLHEPELWATATDELLRFDCPLQMAARVATAKLTVGDQSIAPGEVMYLMLGSGNRDPRKFIQPDGLDLRRSQGRHLAFSHGPHFCVGSSLAVLEAKVMLSALLEQTQGRLHCVDETPSWLPHAGVRGLTQFPVAFSS